jgi:hypothetical protein
MWSVTSHHGRGRRVRPCGNGAGRVAVRAPREARRPGFTVAAGRPSARHFPSVTRGGRRWRKPASPSLPEVDRAGWLAGADQAGRSPPSGAGVHGRRQRTGRRENPRAKLIGLLVAVRDCSTLPAMAKATKGGRKSKSSKTQRTTSGARGTKSKRASAKKAPGPAPKGKSKTIAKVAARRPIAKVKAKAKPKAAPSRNPSRKKTAAAAAAAAAPAASGFVLGGNSDADRTEVDWAERAFSPGQESAAIGDPLPENDESTDE